MLKRSALLIAFVVSVVSSAQAEEPSLAISLPSTITANGLYTNAKQVDEGLETAASGGFRAVASPTLQLGRHWFVYSTVEVSSASFFNGKQYDFDGLAQFRSRQAFVGYSSRIGQVSMLLKAGQLDSAFGLAPVEYDDAKMPLLAPPRPYTTQINLRPDQIPCGTVDLLSQRTGSDIALHCGGSGSEAYGLTPVGLYGLPAVELELSGHRVDMRVQITNSSPTNPQGLLSGSQSAQLTVGAGYTFRTGLHVGFSQYAGPYLDSNLQSALGHVNLAQFHASGTGFDGSWARGPWSIESEWQRFHFDVPGFATSPSVYATYAQIKRIVTPRFFAAARCSLEEFSQVTDGAYLSTKAFQPGEQSCEISGGFHASRAELVKAGVLVGNSGVNAETYPQVLHTFEIQLVTDISSISHSFR